MRTCSVRVSAEALLDAVVDGLNLGVWDPTHVPASDTYITVIDDNGRVGALHLVDPGKRYQAGDPPMYTIEWGPHTMHDGWPT